jgi:dihydrofolate reductase
MKKLRFNAAVSLDGFIARPNGSYDWIINDNSIDFSALYDEFDTIVMGRKTYEVLQNNPPEESIERMKKYVVSSTLRSDDNNKITIINHNVNEKIAEIKTYSGKDIWLFGGGILFRYLLDAGLVDTIELAVMPILLSEGIPLLPPGRNSPRLHLRNSEILQSGIVILKYGL